MASYGNSVANCLCESGQVFMVHLPGIPAQFPTQNKYTDFLYTYREINAYISNFF